MKKIVIYKSKTGFVERYSEWIAKELGCESVSENRVNDDFIKNFDLVIYGGGLYAGKINGLNKMKEKCQSLNKKLVVFCSGATPSIEEDKIEEVKNANLNEKEQQEIPFYYLQGGLDYNKMGFFSRFMMKAMSSALEKKQEKPNTEDGISLKESFDISDKRFIEPLVDYVSRI